MLRNNGDAKAARKVSNTIAALTVGSLVVAASLSLNMFLNPKDSLKRNPLLLVSSILQFILLAVLVGRSYDPVFELLYKNRMVDAVITFHAVFASFIVSSVWLHQFMDHNSNYLAMMTADAVISNIATAVIVSFLYVRTASVTAMKLTAESV
jgi:hypothetical protein